MVLLKTICIMHMQTICIMHMYCALGYYSLYSISRENQRQMHIATIYLDIPQDDEVYKNICVA